MSVVHFDPRRHPRNRVGKFAEALAALGLGGVVVMPHGGKISKRAESSYELRGKAKANRQTVTLPSMAAARMLNDSAQSDHPDSLGGARKYTSRQHFEDRERKVERQRAQVQRSRAGSAKT